MSSSNTIFSWYSRERPLIYPRTVRSVVPQIPTETHAHSCRETIHFLCSGESPVRWFKAIYHIAKEEFWGQTNWEDRNWREGSQYPSWLDFTSWVCASLGLELSTKTAIIDLARGCGSLEAAEREGMMDASWCFLQTGGIIMKYSCWHRPQCRVSGGS